MHAYSRCPNDTLILAAFWKLVCSSVESKVEAPLSPLLELLPCSQLGTPLTLVPSTLLRDPLLAFAPQTLSLFTLSP